MRRDHLLFALWGILAAAFGIAVGELVAAWHDVAFAPIQVVASSAIDLPSAAVKEWATSTFGSSTKTVVVITVTVAVVIVSAAAGLVARTRLAVGALILLGLGAIGVVAGVRRPTGDVFAMIPSLVAGLVAAAALVGIVLLARSGRTRPVPLAAAGPEPIAAPTAAPTAVPATESAINSRRAFLGSAALVVGGGVAYALARSLVSQGSTAVAKVATKFSLPMPATALAPLPPSVQAPIAGMTPFVTPVADFYRIDTTFVVPEVPAEEWSLTIDGLVDKPLRLTYAQLLERPMVERDITIMCVSNPVGGDYIGNARWLGTPLMPILAEAGLDAKADQLLSESIDGWTCSTPVAGLGEREPLLVIGMNGQPLTAEHGFPVRMVIPGLYGFISATKWVTNIKATTYADEAAYWTVRGWATDAPVLTSSRIDLPAGDVSAGPQAIAGVAWAMDGGGVSRVEVQVDDGPWQVAELADQPAPTTWRQWWLAWDATPGDHVLRVRATNAQGQVQTSEERGVAPDGATGYATRSITVA